MTVHCRLPSTTHQKDQQLRASMKLTTDDQNSVQLGTPREHRRGRTTFVHHEERKRTLPFGTCIKASRWLHAVSKTTLIVSSYIIILHFPLNTCTWGTTGRLSRSSPSLPPLPPFTVPPTLDFAQCCSRHSLGKVDQAGHPLRSVSPDDSHHHCPLCVHALVTARLPNVHARHAIPRHVPRRQVTWRQSSPPRRWWRLRQLRRRALERDEQVADEHVAHRVAARRR